MDRAAAAFYEGDGKDLDFYDFEPLPTLPEDEVSPFPHRGGTPTAPTEGFTERPPGPRPPRARSRLQGTPQVFSPPLPAEGPGPRATGQQLWAVGADALQGWARGYRCNPG